MNLVEKYLGEMTKSKFESQIDRAKRDKNRLMNLKATIEDMHGMLTKSDIKHLVNKANDYLNKL